MPVLQEEIILACLTARLAIRSQARSFFLWITFVNLLSANLALNNYQPSVLFQLPTFLSLKLTDS